MCRLKLSFCLRLNLAKVKLDLKDNKRSSINEKKVIEKNIYYKVKCLISVFQSVFDD